MSDICWTTKPRSKGTALGRFITKIRIADSDCWEWTATTDPQGYGPFWNGERLVRPHRWMYEFVHGPVPGGLEVDHLCRNPTCSNPRHLEAVTRAVNTQRGLKGDLKPPTPARDVCGRGHSLAEFGHQRSGRKPGQVECRACRLEDYHRRTKVAS